MTTLEQWLDEAKQLSDDKLWSLAVLAAATAGHRAQDKGRDAIEQACIAFVQAMHKAAGTSELEMRDVN